MLAISFFMKKCFHKVSFYNTDRIRIAKRFHGNDWKFLCQPICSKEILNQNRTKKIVEK